MLDIDNSAVIIVDLQEKLVNAVDKFNLVDGACKIAKATQILNIPTIVTEQYPKGLGSTDSRLKECLCAQYFEKTTFSVLRTPELAERIKSLGKSQIVILGIEAHICVYQTICDLLKEGFDVYFVEDCSASRHELEFRIGTDLIRQIGAKVTCTEMVLFEWLKSSKHPNFKEIQSLIK